MTELYKEAAKLLGLKVDGNHVVLDCNPIAADGRIWLLARALPIYLAHLICEKEGWLLVPDVNGVLFKSIGTKGITRDCFPTPDAVIRAFVEKYGKKKDELLELQDFIRGVVCLSDPSSNERVIVNRIDTLEKFILKSLKSLSERMDKMEGKC